MTFHDPQLPPPERYDGRGLVFWYQATGLSRASASCQYRIGNIVEHLRGAVSIIHPRPPERWWAHAHTLIVVRPHLDRHAEQILAKARAKGIRLVADFDDLLFAGDPAKYPLVLRGTLSVEEARRRLNHVRESLAQFDAFTASTEVLAAHLREAVGLERDVRQIPNGLSAAWVRQGRMLYPRWRPGDPRIIRYLAGSPSHDVDFATIAPVLRRFLDAHPDVSFETVGPVAIGEDWPSGRMTQHARVSYSAFPHFLASSWVTLAPLWNCAFNRAKSAIKLLESAAFGAPCIVTPTTDMLRHRDAKPFYARCERDWWSALEAMRDDDTRMERGRHAQRYVFDHATSSRSARLWTQSPTDNPPPRHPPPLTSAAPRP